MAARLYAEFTSSYFIDYVIEFHDNEFTGAAQKIQVSGDGFQLNYSGQTDNIYSPIIGSSVNVGIVNQGEPHLLEYISLLKQYQQDRFAVVIYRGASARFINNLSNVASLLKHALSPMVVRLNRQTATNKTSLIWAERSDTFHRSRKNCIGLEPLFKI